MLLPIHIVAGGLAIVLGALALIVRKGGTLHRSSGSVFVYAMVVMGISASIMAFRKSPTDPNVLGGFVTVYFVGTALTTVRSASRWTRVLDIVLLMVAIGLTGVQIALGVIAWSAPRHFLNGVPFAMYLFLATITGLAAAGDARIMRSGTLLGKPRLARHLWRMCFALFIAAGSFFSIPSRVARILPAPFTTAPMRALPILLVFGAMFYWLWRLRRRGVAALSTRR